MTAGRACILLAGVMILVAGLLMSVLNGAAAISPNTVLHSLFAFNAGNPDHLVIREIRLPRALAAALAGSCLAVAGAIMQGMTRNPLASPSLMGLNAGAGLLLAVGVAFLPWLGFSGLIVLSLAGAALGAAMVYGIGSAHPGGLSPVRLALAGAIVSALLGALTTILVTYYRIAQDILFYVAGGVQGVQWPQLLLVLPWMGVGMAAALALSRAVSLLALGTEVATGLGQNVRLARIGGTLATLLLAGSAVALAGGIGFVGLVVPHMVRSILGLDYRWIIPGSAVAGATLVVIADLLARMVNPPFETPIGLITALVGVPFFLYLARRDGRGL